MQGQDGMKKSLRGGQCAVRSERRKGGDLPSLPSIPPLPPVHGQGGIRTHGTLARFTRSPGVCLQPLGHLSQATKGAKRAARRPSWRVKVSGGGAGAQEWMSPPPPIRDGSEMRTP